MISLLIQRSIKRDHHNTFGTENFIVVISYGSKSEEVQLVLRINSTTKMFAIYQALNVAEVKENREMVDENHYGKENNLLEANIELK